MISGLFKQEREKGHYKKSSLSITSTPHPYTDERLSKLLAFWVFVFSVWILWL